jgi:hypothetical protein
MTHGREVVYFIGLHFLYNADQVGAVCHVPVMQPETNPFFMWVLVQVIDTAGIDQRRASFYAMHHISFFK